MMQLFAIFSPAPADNLFALLVYACKHLWCDLSTTVQMIEELKTAVHARRLPQTVKALEDIQKQYFGS